MILMLVLYFLEYIFYKIWFRDISYYRFFIFIKTKLCMNLSTHLYSFILHVPSQNTNVHSSMTFPSYMQIKLSVMTYLSQYRHLLQKTEWRQGCIIFTFLLLSLHVKYCDPFAFVHFQNKWLIIWLDINS